MEMISLINKILALGTIVAQIFIFLVVVYYLFFRKSFVWIEDFVGKNGLLFAFVISLVSTIASLFYSEFAGFAPCELCWFQRIFIYPLVILIPLALWKKDFKIAEYLLPFSVIGFLISLYQNYVYYYNNGLDASCQLGGSQVSCIKRYILELGYISIPVMALTSFALILIFLFLQKKYNNKIN